MTKKLFIIVCSLVVLGQTVNARAQDSRTPTSAPGVTQALQEIKLSMTVAGRIEVMMVREGSNVRAGDLLLHLDRRQEDLEVQRRQLLVQDQIKITELRQKEKVLSAQVQSLRPLLDSGGVSRKQLEDEEISLSSTIAERRTLEAAKEREIIELQLAREAYEKRHLRAQHFLFLAKLCDLDLVLN